ncbi:MAG: efflux RND transporter periplasmic adaptor subunit [Deltaproteobacteria bacterium]|nr:efflux RND transporter periplasmic adaptor subunit [Deltaproteobacteria bacterium]MBI2500991.1 efflux RND transporter periplasmic adaptor subunit [Deltaproteobacteria bacterium]
MPLIRGTLSALIICLVLVSCGGAVKDERGKKGSLFQRREKKPISVATLRVAAKEIPFVLKAKGKTEVSDKFQVKAPEVTSRVAEIYVEEGQSVEKESPLLRFDDEPLREKLELLRTEQEEAEKGLEDARYLDKNKERLLAAEKMIQEEADGLDERIQKYESTLERVKAEITSYEKQITLTEVKAPIAGLITKRDVSVGEKTEKDKLILEVVLIEPLRFIFDAPLEVVTSMKIGDPIPVVFSSLKKKEFVGAITTVGAEAGAGGDVQVKLLLPNQTQELKGEVEGEINYPTSIKEKVILIPSQALLKTERSTYVFKIVDKKAKRVPIGTAGEHGGEVIVTRGLEEGDVVITSPIQNLKDGSLVEMQSS